MAIKIEDWHGTENGYNNRKCPCEDCREAHRIYIKEKRQKRAARRVLINGRLVAAHIEIHGSASTYTNHVCRCDPCTKAHSAMRWGK